MKLQLVRGLSLFFSSLLAASPLAAEPAAADPKPAPIATPSPCLEHHAWCCKNNDSCTIIGGIDVVYVKAYSSTGTNFELADILGFNDPTTGLPLGATQPLEIPVDADYEFTLRFWAGVQLADGLGIRARYWSFDQNNTGVGAIPVGHTINGGITIVPGELTAFQTWDATVIDLEVIDTLQLGCDTSLTWSIGGRYVDYEETRGAFGGLNGVVFVPLDIVQQRRFDGFGLTGSLEARRRVCHEFGLYGGVRGSLLVGDEDNQYNFRLGATPQFQLTNTEENVKWIFETQAGLEYATSTHLGTLSVRGGVEFQYWSGFGAARGSITTDEDTGFFGLTFSIGLIR